MDSYQKEQAKFRRPIPGQSLTNDPNSPLPFEGPPQFTKRKEAVEDIFANMIREEVYPEMMQALMQGTTVMNMTEVILFEGFRQGKWNPDLLLMLIEPTAYMIIALAERGGIDFQIDGEPEEEPEETKLEQKFDKLVKKVKISKSKHGVLPKEIEKKIEELPVESLLAKPEAAPVEEEMAEESLIQKPEVV